MPTRTLSESEFNAVKQKVLDSLPANWSEADFNRQAPGRLAAAIAEAENSPAPIEGSAAGRFLSNAGEMLNPVTMAVGTYNAVRHPLDTAAGIIEQMGEQWSKAKQAAEQGHYTEAAARAVTGSVPIAGPLVADIGEQVGRGDYAGAAGKVTGLAVPFAAEKALAARTASQAGRVPILTREAEQQVAGRVLAPGNPKFRAPAAKIAPEVLQRGLKGTRAELQQIAAEGMDDAGMRIDQGVQAAGGTHAPVGVQEPITFLEGRIKDLKDSTGTPLSDQAARRIQLLQQRIYQLRSMGGKTGQAIYNDLQKFRDENYRIGREARAYEQKGNPQLSDEGWAAMQSGAAIQDTFAQRSPATAAANADYHFFKTLNDILDPAIGRPKSTASPAGVTGGAKTTGAVVGGMVGGKVGAFIMSEVRPWLTNKLNSPEWQLADAQRKIELAKALQRGDIGRAKTLMARWSQFAPKTTTPNESQTPAGATP